MKSNIKLYLGNCIGVMKTLDDNSIDSIVSDPPYELGFMGKTWDNTGIANSVEMWKECLRVLKPGGHLLAFSATRTYHRMACAIEDAGFEIRDMIEWVYGCLSEDTEILTESGYKPLRKLTQYDRIGVYDITNNIYKWERPQGYSVYKVHQDAAYRIKSDYTDQIISRNHRCLVEREGKLVFVTAEELNEVEYMPTLPDDFYSLQENSNRKLLLKELLRKGKGLAQTMFSKWTGKIADWKGISDGKKSGLERWSNLLEETRKLQADKICEVSEGVFTDGEKRWICNGTSFDSGSILGDMLRESSSHTSYQSRPTGQPTGKPDVISIKQGTQITRRARITKIEYSGIIFCPTVSTGALVARRNGQVFITGNSGFPKSLNIGKAVDKLQGNERDVIGSYKVPDIKGDAYGTMNEKQGGSYRTIEVNKTKGASEYEGWGTALKPAHEPICMARKPLSEKTVVENCLKWRTGGINIDESRIETTNKYSYPHDNSGNTFSVGEEPDGKKTEPIESNVLGRFPANLICDNSEEVRECFPETKSGRNNGNAVINVPHENDVTSLCRGTLISRNDDGNASRFFKSIIYQAKANKTERNSGCENLETSEKFTAGNYSQSPTCKDCNLTLNGTNDHSKCSGEVYYKEMESKNTKNNHPTVKPIALMEYLIKMVTPKGGIVLDPFMGSGSTGCAAKKNRFGFIGIELCEEYIQIARERIKNANKEE